MPKVDLIATRDFTYNTRRLVAGDPFQARNPMDARILERVRKVAEAPSDTVEMKVAPEVDLVTFEDLKTEPTEILAVKPILTVKKAPKARGRKAKAKK